MDTGRQMTLASAFSPHWPKGGENEEKGGERFLPRVGGLKTRGRIGSPAPLSLYVEFAALHERGALGVDKPTVPKASASPAS